jgi:uncharacterized protein (TIGR03435 family)
MNRPAPWARAAAILLAASIAGPHAGLAQGPEPVLAFDAVSVKESQTLELDGVFNSTPGRFTVTNLSLRWIIRYAFRLRDYQVIDAPGWTETRYMITATFANPAASDADIRAMLQRLLAERFNLRARREQRNLQMYRLVNARQAGPLGPKLTRSAVDCSVPPAGRAALPPPAGGRARPTCTMFQTAWFIRGFSRTMPQLAQVLDATIGSPVADHTGLTGSYDFDVQWGTPTTTAADPSIQTPDSIAALFTAVQEQLGLRLVATRGPYDVLVIDSVSRPTPD